MRTAWRPVHKGMIGILTNTCIRSPSGEKFGLLYGVALRTEAMRVLGYPSYETSSMVEFMWRELKRIYRHGHFWWE